MNSQQIDASSRIYITNRARALQGHHEGFKIVACHLLLQSSTLR